MSYPANLPLDLACHYSYLEDGGHIIHCVPSSLLPEAEKSGVMEDYIVPLPVRYVLEKGYTVSHGFPVVNVPYDSCLGAQVDEEYEEYDSRPSQEVAEPQMKAYAVRQKYAEMATGVYQEIRLRFNGSSLTYVILYNNPTPVELDNFKNGPIQVKLAVVEGVMVFLIKFGTLEWMEAPAYPNSPQDPLLPDMTYALDVVVFDSRTGELVVNRLFGLEKEFSALVKSEYDKLRNVPFDPQGAYLKSMAMFAKYDTTAILAQAIETKHTHGN